MERDVLRKIQAQQQKSTPHVDTQEDQPFDLKTASPIDLQQMIGNRATSQLLAGGGTGPVVQTKMTVTDANDAHEKEADKVAEQIVSGGKSEPVQRADEEEMGLKRIQREGEEEELSMKRIQREGEEEELSMKRIQRMDEEELSMKRIQREGEEEELSMKRIQRMDDDASMSDDDLAAKRIQRKQTDMSKSFDVGGKIEDEIRGKSGGQSLDTGIQTKMEDGTGHDFSNVRVHTDNNADALSESLGARAFTSGSDIFFKQGEYNPGSDEGQKHIAHEATHVIQQGGTQLKREDD